MALRKDLEELFAGAFQIKNSPQREDDPVEESIWYGKSTHLDYQQACCCDGFVYCIFLAMWHCTYIWRHPLYGFSMVCLNIVSNILNSCSNILTALTISLASAWRFEVKAWTYMYLRLHTENLWWLSLVVNFSHLWVSLHSKSLGHHCICLPYMLWWTNGET